MSGELPKVLVIAGPTGIGKSSTAIELAKIVDGEIISADSVQMYRGMEIGSGQVTKQQQCSVKHHLLSIFDPIEIKTTVDFFNFVREAIADVLSRGRVPIVVGGGGQYLHTVINGVPQHPPRAQTYFNELDSSHRDDSMKRKQMQERMQALPYLKREIVNKYITDNPQIHYNTDTRRLERLIEIVELTGDLPQKQLRPVSTAPYDFRCVFLAAQKRAELYHSIDARCEQMVQDGLLEEVMALDQAGKLGAVRSSTIGYRHALDFLSTDCTHSQFLYFLDAFKATTRHYARKQLCWFRKETDYVWIPKLSGPPTETLLSQLQTVLAYSSEDYCEVRSSLEFKERQALLRYQADGNRTYRSQNTIFPNSEADVLRRDALTVILERHARFRKDSHTNSRVITVRNNEP